MPLLDDEIQSFGDISPRSYKRKIICGFECRRKHRDVFKFLSNAKYISSKKLRTLDVLL